MMKKLGLEDCLDAGSVMVGRCLAIMQHFHGAAWDHLDLWGKIADLERQVKQLSKEKVDKDSTFTSK